MTMKAVENITARQTHIGSNKLKFPDPRPFKGNRDAKELENFIFDVEQYFKATTTCTYNIKVTIASRHLIDDAKLWWRTKVQDIENGLCTIDSWEDLKRELRDQFFPENVEHMAMEKLITLKQTGSIRDYLRQFSTLMLDIRGTSEKYKVFFFINGLQPWAKTWVKTKIHEKKVQDLATAIASVERLLDFGNEASFQRRTTQAPNTGRKTYRTPGHRNEGPNRLNGSNVRSSGWTDRSPQNNQGGTSRGPYPQKNYPTAPYNACCIKAPTDFSIVLIGPLSVHYKCPFKKAMTQESRLR